MSASSPVEWGEPDRLFIPSSLLVESAGSANVLFFPLHCWDCSLSFWDPPADFKVTWELF